MHLSGVDHIVLTVADVTETVTWYQRVLGMTPVVFGEGRHALTFGNHKINIHQAGHEIEPHAIHPTTGSADICLVSGVPLRDLEARLRLLDVPVRLGPAPRTGATGPITSLYLRDPDGNLVEVCTYDSGRPTAPDPYDILPPVTALAVHSADIRDREQLSSQHVHRSAGGADISPGLTWTGSPPGTRGHAVTCFDPDAPTGSGFWHWMLIGLPADWSALERNAGRGDGPHLPPGARHLRSDFGTPRYGGAAAPPSDPPHRYVFAVHALDTQIEPAADTPAAQAGFAIVAHTLARGVLRPTYQRS